MDNIVWATMYANIVAMERHPGRFKDGNQPLSLKVLAELADGMFREYQHRWTHTGTRKWQSGQG